MADFYDSAAAANTAQKQALIDAIRTQGSQAKAALDQATQQIQAERAQALAAALAASQQRGAPQALIDQNAATVGSGYDRQLADLAASGASRQAALGNTQAAAGTYFDEANAALPVLRSRQQLQDSINQTNLSNRLAQLKAQQDMATSAGQRQLQQLQMQIAGQNQAGQTRLQELAMNLEGQRQSRIAAQQQADYEKQIRDLQLAVATANAQKAAVGLDTAQSRADQQATKAATPKPPTLSSIGGVSGFNAGVDQIVKQNTVPAGSGTVGGTASFAANALIKKIAPAQAAQSIGLPEAVGQGLYDAHQAAQQQAAAAAQTKASTAAQQAADRQAEFDPNKVSSKTGISVGKVREIQQADYYKQAAASTEANLGLSNKDGSAYTREQLLADLNKHFGKYPTTIKVIMAEYGDLFPTNAQARGALA